VPPTLLVLFLTRRNGGEGAVPGVIGSRVGVPPRVAVVRDGLVRPIELPVEREGAARLLGAVALPAWVHNEEFAPPPEHMDLRRRAADVHRSMDMSSATESRARKQDLGPALKAAGLRPSDYLDIDLKGNRKRSANCETRATTSRCCWTRNISTKSAGSSTRPNLAETANPTSPWVGYGIRHRKRRC